MMKLIHLSALLLCAHALKAQSPAFSQFYALPAAMNPAYVSTVNGIEAQAGYRRQWKGIQSGFDTKFANASIRFCKAPIAFGTYLSEISESFFGYREQEAGLQVGGFLGNPERFTLHGALQGGVGQRGVDFARLLFAGQIDPVFGVQGQPSAYFLNDGSRLQTFEVGFGMVGRGLLKWNNTELPASLGASVLHANRQEVSFLPLSYKQALRWTIHGSVTTPVVGGLKKTDLFYINWIARLEGESALKRATTGCILQYSPINIGLFYQWNKSPFATRNTHGMTLSIGYDFDLSDRLSCSVQYAFDGTVGGLEQGATNGAHELILTCRLPETCIFSTNDRGRTDCFDYRKSKRKDKYRRFLN